MRVALSGSRTFPASDAHLVEHVLERLLERGDFIIIGDAPDGVDAFAYDYLEYIPSDRWKRYYANWHNLGRAAGHFRNGDMLETADMLIAMFAPGQLTPGTQDACRQAAARRLPIHVFHEGKWTQIAPQTNVP